MSDDTKYPPVLDACCSKRAFWFDAQDTRALFVDKREETIVRKDSSNRKGYRVLEIAPDKVADFTALPFPSDTFAHVVWVIVGGETGPGARPMYPDWVREVRGRCQGAGVPFFFKRWGQHRGRMLDGRTWDEFPKGGE